MQIQLRYFASIREALATNREAVTPPPEVTTVGELRSWLCSRGGTWAEALAEGRSLRTALDQKMCGPETPLTDNGEVAFFPPVTGG
jgi:molybdopterin synthase sulfur carrier subunit